MSVEKIFVCGTVRNCEPYLDACFRNIKRITDKYADFRIIISFDVSEDKSLITLIKYKHEFGDKMDIIINRIPRSHKRTENISNARNLIIRNMRDKFSSGFDMNEWKYFIMIDMDDVCSHYMDYDVITRAFLNSDKWDTVSFNRPGYYDLWALSIDSFIYGCWGWHNPFEVVEIMRSHIIEKLKNTPLDEYVECRSAFNGFAIYKTAMFIDCDYDWRMPKQYMKLEDILENKRVLGNRPSNSPLDKQTDEMDCEHRAFHMMATAKNGARIRISPEVLFHPGR
jgi:hypothetical protein